jgi:hypothetical protein
MTNRTVTSASTTVIVDLIDVITVTAGPIIATTTWINVIIAATTTVMIEATTIVATIATTGETTERVIATMNIVKMISVMIDVSKTTTTAITTTARSAVDGEISST